MAAAPVAVMLIMEVGVKQISIAGKMLEKLGKIYPRDAKLRQFHFCLQGGNH